MLSYAPRPVSWCRGTRYPEAKLRRERTERKFNSERGVGNLKGKAYPCEDARRLKVVVKAGERINRLIDDVSI